MHIVHSPFYLFSNVYPAEQPIKVEQAFLLVNHPRRDSIIYYLIFRNPYATVTSWYVCCTIYMSWGTE